MVRTFIIYPCSSFEIYNPILLLNIVTMLCDLFPKLSSPVCNWKHVLWPPSPHFLTLQTLITSVLLLASLRWTFLHSYKTMPYLSLCTWLISDFLKLQPISASMEEEPRRRRKWKLLHVVNNEVGMHELGVIIDSMK